MNDRDKIVRKIGKTLDRSLGSGSGDSSLEMQKRFLISTMASHTERRDRRFLLVAVAACFAMGVAFVLYLMSDTESGGQEILPSYSLQDVVQPRFRIGDDAGFSVAGSLVQSTADGSAPIVFENGSRFDLFGTTSVRIVETHPERVAVRLLDGRLHSSINGNGITQWVVLAGPYTVKVLGTVFSVVWGEKGGTLQVQVEEGHVLVSDGSDSKADVNLTSGQVMSVTRDMGEALSREETSEAREETSETEENISERKDDELETSVRNIGLVRDVVHKKQKRSVVEDPTESTRRDDEPAETVEMGWRENCALGKCKAAIENASRSSLDEMGTEADLETLWRLANSARYLKRAEVAKNLFSSLRKRFPEAGRARTAAFLIAKTALELEGDKGSARRWFERYLSETSAGGLREEALGHLIFIAISSGSSQEAERQARRYLEHYPNGLYSKRAHEIVSP